MKDGLIRTGVLALMVSGAAVGCGSSSENHSASGSGGASGPGTGGAAGATSATGGNAGAVVGEGLAGSYDFGTRSPWGGSPGAAGAAGAPAYGGSTAAKVCKDYKPPALDVEPPSETDCAAVTAKYDLLEYRTSYSLCFPDRTPAAACTMNATALTTGACGNTDGWALDASGFAFFGAGFMFWAFEQDYSAWDGIGVWIRSAPGTSANVEVEVQDSNYQPPVDPVTGKPTCYDMTSGIGADWDGDGYPNLSPPPQNLMCPLNLWTTQMSVADQWRFVMLPWSLWSADLKPAALKALTFVVKPCADLHMDISWVGAYRAKP